MVSEQKLIANKENAKLGGVKTEAGKAAVRLNAVTHGLLTKEVLLPGEDSMLLDALRQSLMTEKQAQGELETMLVEHITCCIWRLRRVIKVDTGMLGDDWTGIAAYTVTDTNSWQNINRYETTIERQLYKAMHELERLQSIREGKNVPAPLVIDAELSN